MRTVWVLGLLALTRVGAKPKEDKSIMKAPEIHSDELAVRLQSSMAPTFVLFTANWCTDSDNLATAWDAVSRDHDYMDDVRVVRVDCSGAGERACAVHGISVLPTATLFPAMDIYDGPFVEAAVREWVETRIPRLVSGRKRRRKPVKGCAAWRATQDCDPDGDRDPSKDLSCMQEVLGKRSGYCDCGDGRTVKHSDCGDDWRKAFRCVDECAESEVCEGWKQTSKCLGSGHRDTRRDRGCFDLIESEASGYCECVDGIRAAQVDCRHEPFNCEDKCREALTAARKAEKQAEEKRKRDRRARIDKARRLGYIREEGD